MIPKGEKLGDDYIVTFEIPVIYYAQVWNFEDEEGNMRIAGDSEPINEKDGTATKFRVTKYTKPGEIYFG